MLGMVLILTGCSGTTVTSISTSTISNSTQVTQNSAKDLKVEYDKGYKNGFKDGVNSVTKPQTTPSTTSSVPKKDIYKFTVGETLPITSDKGNYELTVEGVRVTEDRNQFSDIKPTKVFFLNYNYKNIDREDDFYLSSSTFYVIDAEGNICDSYPVSDSSRRAMEVPPGVKSKGSEGYALTTDSAFVIVQVRGGSYGDKVIAETQIQLNE